MRTYLIVTGSLVVTLLWMLSYFASFIPPVTQ